MEKKWYRSNPVKLILMIAFTISVILGVIGGTYLAALAYQKITIWGDAGKTYLDSESLTQSMFSSSREILEGIKAQTKLVSAADGGQSSNVIDLKDAQNDGELTAGETTGADSGISYSLDTLKQWAKSGWDYTDGKSVVVCTADAEDGAEYYYDCDEFIRMIDAGTMELEWDSDYDLSVDMIKQLLRSNQFWDTYSTFTYEDLRAFDAERKVYYSAFYNYDGTLIEEKYAPQGADSFLDAVNGSDVWRGRLEEANAALENALNETAGMLNVSASLAEYQEGNTNLVYLYVDQVEKKVYTNRAAYASYEDCEKSLEKIKEGGAYVAVSPTLANCGSDLRVGSMGLEQWQHMVQVEGISDEFIFAAAVDKEFPIQDSLAAANENYNLYMSLRPLTGQLLGTALVLFLVSIVWLTMAAGRRADDEEIHLNFFDHIFTEAAAAGIFLVWIGGLGLGAEVLSFFTGSGFQPKSMEFQAIAAAVGAYTAGMFLLGWLSLVRRVKARSLWKDSLLRRLCRCFKKLWEKLGGILEYFSVNTGSRVTMVLAAVVFLFLQVCLVGMIFEGGAFFLLLLMIVDCAAMLYVIRRAEGRDRILEGLKRITGGELQYKIPEEKLFGTQKQMAEYINRIGEGLDAAVENSLKNERMKTELITNVSHDIKTPLTSIINYVDLLKREHFTDPKICGYLDILDEKAHRLKILTEDVVEASKASSGAIALEWTDLNFIEMLHQVMGEFEERFQEKNLTLMVHLTDEAVMIRADGRRLWRVLDNIFNNVVKYAMEGTRVYAEATPDGGRVTFSLKNISAQPLNISADELTERFIRGDSSRNTEGSGLGLSIARSLTELMGGEFKLYLDGDLFKVMITFPLVK